MVIEKNDQTCDASSDHHYDLLFLRVYVVLYETCHVRLCSQVKQTRPPETPSRHYQEVPFSPQLPCG